MSPSSPLARLRGAAVGLLTAGQLLGHLLLSAVGGPPVSLPC
jgi:hypothetical protein